MNTNDLRWLPCVAPAKDGQNYSRLMVGQFANATSCLTHKSQANKSVSEQGRARDRKRRCHQAVSHHKSSNPPIQESAAHVAFASFVPLRLIGRAARTVKINSVNFVNSVQKNLRHLGVPRAKFVKRNLNKSYSKPNFNPNNSSPFVYMKSSHSPMNPRMFSPQTNWFSFSYTLVKSQIPNTPLFAKRSTDSVALLASGALSARHNFSGGGSPVASAKVDATTPVPSTDTLRVKKYEWDLTAHPISNYSSIVVVGSFFKKSARVFRRWFFTMALAESIRQR
jgi:hypothetical protein